MSNETRTGMRPYLCFCYPPTTPQTNHHGTLNIGEQHRGIRFQRFATQYANAVTMSAVSRVASVTRDRGRASDVILQLHARPHTRQKSRLQRRDRGLGRRAWSGRGDRGGS